MMKKYSKSNTQNNYNSIEVKIGVRYQMVWFVLFITSMIINQIH